MTMLDTFNQLLKMFRACARQFQPAIYINRSLAEDLKLKAVSVSPMCITVGKTIKLQASYGKIIPKLG